MPRAVLCGPGKLPSPEFLAAACGSIGPQLLKGEAAGGAAAEGMQNETPLVAIGAGEKLNIGDAEGERHGKGRPAIGLPDTGEAVFCQASAVVLTCMLPFSSKLKKRGCTP